MQDRRPVFLLQIQVAAENKSWIENNRSIFDDLELQLILRVKVKMLYENLKTYNVIVEDMG